MYNVFFLIDDMDKQGYETSSHCELVDSRSTSSQWDAVRRTVSLSIGCFQWKLSPTIQKTENTLVLSPDELHIAICCSSHCLIYFWILFCSLSLNSVSTSVSMCYRAFRKIQDICTLLVQYGTQHLIPN